MSTVSCSTTSTTAYKVTADTTGTLVLQTGATPTTAMTISSAQVVNFANTPTVAGSPITTAAATATTLGTVYGRMTTSGASPYLTALGYNAGVSTTGAGVTAVGQEAAYTNSTGTQNIAMGYQALYSNSTNSFSTAVGYQALKLATGGQNTAVGRMSMQALTTGSGNTGLGVNALYTATTSVNSVAVGDNALFSTTTGSYNVAVGQAALQNNTTANNNTAVGYQAGYTQTSSGANGTFLGYQAGYSSTGSSNCFVGYQAGYASTGTYNMFFGRSSGESMTTGSSNVILGRYSGNSGGLNITTSNNNVVISDGDGNVKNWYDSLRGYWGATTSVASCIYNFAGSFNTYRGIAIQCSDSATNMDAVMFYTQSTQRGTIVCSPSGTAYNSVSDYRLKENVQPMSGALAKLARVKPVTYTWKDSGADGQGFIAHELQEVFPDAVSGEKDAVYEDGSPNYQGIDTSFLVATLASAIKELKAELDAAKAEIAALKGQA